MYAILIECDPGTTLGGSCFRDVHNMATYLISKCHFLPECIYVLTTSMPKQGIIGVNYRHSLDIIAVHRDVQSYRPKYMVVLLSGHGFGVGDADGDETDGQDEAITVGQGMITDDMLYSEIVQQCQCNMLLLSDTCHSGTMFDLPKVWNGSQFVKQSCRDDSVTTCKVFSLSACSDSQLSMCDVGDETGFGGSLCTALVNGPLFGEFISGQSDKTLMHMYETVRDKLSLLSQTVLLSML